MTKYSLIVICLIVSGCHTGNVAQDYAGDTDVQDSSLNVHSDFVAKSIHKFLQSKEFRFQDRLQRDRVNYAGHEKTDYIVVDVPILLGNEVVQKLVSFYGYQALLYTIDAKITGGYFTGLPPEDDDELAAFVIYDTIELENGEKYKIFWIRLIRLDIYNGKFSAEISISWRLDEENIMYIKGDFINNQYIVTDTKYNLRSY